jgi:DNA-binding winged helix-turn-helix (wHTH) protein
MLHVRVSEIRHALRPGRVDRNAGIVTYHSGYQLQVGVDELDSRRFERLAAAGRQALTRSDNVIASHRSLMLRTSRSRRLRSHAWRRSTFKPWRTG